MGLGSARPGGVVNRGIRGPGDGPSYPAPETPSLTLGALAYLGSPGMPHLRPRSDAEALSQPPHQGSRHRFEGHRLLSRNLQQVGAVLSPEDLLGVRHSGPWAGLWLVWVGMV